MILKSNERPVSSGGPDPGETDGQSNNREPIEWLGHSCLLQDAVGLADLGRRAVTARKNPGHRE